MAWGGVWVLAMATPRDPNALIELLDEHDRLTQPQLRVRFPGLVLRASDAYAVTIVTAQDCAPTIVIYPAAAEPPPSEPLAVLSVPEDEGHCATGGEQDPEGDALAAASKAELDQWPPRSSALWAFVNHVKAKAAAAGNTVTEMIT